MPSTPGRYSVGLQANTANVGNTSRDLGSNLVCRCAGTLSYSTAVQAYHVHSLRLRLVSWLAASSSLPSCQTCHSTHLSLRYHQDQHRTIRHTLGLSRWRAGGTRAGIVAKTVSKMTSVSKRASDDKPVHKHSQGAAKMKHSREFSPCANIKPRPSASLPHSLSHLVRGRPAER